MVTPREAAQTHNPGAGAKTYCGICGTPDCICAQYKERGAVGATNAGSAHTDDKPMKGGNNNPGNGNNNGGNNNGGEKPPPFGKKEGGEKAPPFGKKE